MGKNAPRFNIIYTYITYNIQYTIAIFNALRAYYLSIDFLCLRL